MIQIPGFCSMLYFMFTVLTAIGYFRFSLAANILIVSPVSSPSQANIFRPFIQGLLERNHSVTFLNAFQVNGISPARHVVLNRGADLARATRNEYLPGGQGLNIYGLLDIFGTITTRRCQEILEQQEVQDMVNGKIRIDLVVTTILWGECGLALAYKLKAPLIFLGPTHLMGQFANNLRLSHPTTYVPFLYTSYSPSMTFWERLSNLASYTMMTLHRELVYIPNRNVELRKIFGEELPCMLEMERNASLMFLYTHVSMGHPQPHMPNTIEIGGMHLRPGNSLPQDLKNWIDGAGSAGVIYFSLGTMQIASKTLNEDVRHLFLKVFSKLPQRVIWKWESDEMHGLPDNVRVFKFLPQQDILAHNSTKAFITHGGLLSTQEAMYHAVPVIVLPGGWDQPFNAKNIVSKKGGIMLSWKTITAQSLTDALNTVIHDPSYKESLEKISNVYKGQPMSAIDKAMYWVDFVIKHKGAGHLRSHALQLTWYQYYGLDIVVLVVTCFVVTLWLFFFILHRLCQGIMKKTGRMNALKKKKA